MCPVSLVAACVLCLKSQLVCPVSQVAACVLCLKSQLVCPVSQVSTDFSSLILNVCLVLEMQQYVEANNTKTLTAISERVGYSKSVYRQQFSSLES